MTKSLPSIISPRSMNCAEKGAHTHFGHFFPQSLFLSLTFFFVLFLSAPMDVKGETAEAWEDEFSFDVEEFEKKELEWGGFAELKWVHADVDTDSAIYALNKGTDKVAKDQGQVSLQLDGRYNRDIFSLHWTLKGYLQDDDQHDVDHDADVYETYLSIKPTPMFSAGVGKKSYKWGKGYAWNPVGFINRPKDPNDPEEAMEGFITGEADVIKSFSGPLQTVALTTVLLPVRKDLNDDFGRSDHLNLAAKLYMLYLDTELGVIVYTGNSRSTRFGADFSRNLAPNFECHGELAFIPGLRQTRLADDGSVETGEVQAWSWLVGIRYLSENNITSIIEYYGNDAGLSSEQAEQFYELVEKGEAGESAALTKAGRLADSGYARPQPGRNYLYLRCTQKEPFGILYYTPGITSIINLDDGSFSLAPELVYDGLENWEFRGRFSWLQGGAHTEYGEKANNSKLEVRVRYFF